MAISRRDLMKLFAATTLPTWIEGQVHAQTAAPAVRYSVTGSSPEAQEAVARYRAAVANIKERADHDPTSWIWQANIHGWPGQFLTVNAPTAEAEFARVFESGPILTELSSLERQARRHMAESTWGTCPHGGPDFLPWHRVYLFLFERILQDAIQDNTVTVPYWDWHRDRALPAAFRAETIGGTSNALYWNQRNLDVNGNAPTELISAEVSHNSLLERCFDQSLEPSCEFTVSGGFSPSLESGPHGNVHVFVGGVRGMGFFEMAARDPIFFAHHGNIDRLWSSWVTSPSNAEPTGATDWLHKEHTFIDTAGELQVLSTAQVLKASDILGRGYVYDTLETVTPLVVAGGGAAVEQAPRTFGDGGGIANEIARGEGLELSADTVSVPLEISSSVPVTAAADDARYVLVLSELSFETGPQDNFMVFLNLPETEKASPESESFLTVINFFVTPHSSVGHHRSNEAVVRIDVTDAVRRLTTAGGLRELRVSFASIRGNVPNDARPTIGSIQLFSE